MLLDDLAMQSVPRPGTSLSCPQVSKSGMSQAIRPVSSSGRPMTGFARPGTSSRPLTGTSGGTGASRTGSAKARVSTALRGNKPGTARPTTTSGRFIRLGTASMATQPGGAFIDVERLDLEKYSQRPHLARVLCDYILYNDHNAKAAAILCAAATVRSINNSAENFQASLFNSNCQLLGFRGFRKTRIKGSKRCLIRFDDCNAELELYTALL